MIKTIGEMDQTVRLIAGIVLLALALIVDGDWRWGGLLGLILIITAIVRVCPLYTFIGINTCEKENLNV